MSASAPVLSVTGLGKSYGVVRALAGVDFALRPGEVHALVGENGAGKSTLSRILAGLARPDTGALELAGRPYRPRSRADAERCGVRIVLQELNLIPTLTVAESLFLDRLPHRWGWIDQRELRRQARIALARVGLADLNPAQPVSALGVGQQQMIEIAAGLARRCDVLILDEPTAALTTPEIETLFAQLAKLQAAGTAILYISHRLEEVRRLADRVSVLRDGQLIATRAARELSLGELMRLMVGRELAATVRHPRSTGPVALEVRGLRHAPAVQEVSFTVRRSEILGLAGLMGSGRTETLRALFGADCRDAGEIRLRGEAQPARLESPHDAVRLGMALLTEDRKAQGLLLPLGIRANLTLPSLPRFAGLGGWLQQDRETTAAHDWISRLGIRCRDPEQRAVELSGGNQQKLVLAKWLLRDCDVLLFDEPTRGIDVGAKLEIHRLLDRLADQGKAILVVSSDLPELMAVCDRIAVMSSGRLVATFDRGEWSEDRIMAAAFSGHLGKPAK